MSCSLSPPLLRAVLLYSQYCERCLIVLGDVSGSGFAHVTVSVLATFSSQSRKEYLRKAH